MEFFVIIYVISHIFSIISALLIGEDDEVFDFEMALKRKRDFIRCVFMWQFAVYEYLNEEINTAGIVILEIITTTLIFPENIMALASLLICCYSKELQLRFIRFFVRETRRARYQNERGMRNV